VRYSEIFLKGENRRLFEDVLVRNVQRALTSSNRAGLRARRHHARLVIEAEAGLPGRKRSSRTRSRSSSARSACRRLRSRSRCRRTSSRSRRSARACSCARRGRFGRPHVQGRRPPLGQALPARTFEINDVVGQAARLASGLSVDVKDPDISLVAEIGPELSFVSAHSARGPSGCRSA
jgi:adenylyl- and sulfurtransferase ThiI